MFLYLDKTVSPKALVDFLNTSFENGIFPRTMQIIKGNNPLLRFAFEPYDLDEPMHLYSLSKSFTSIACGICIDAGLLSADTKMCELFADKMPETLTDALKEMTLADLLSMQSGHAACVLEHMRWAEDSVKEFFARPTVHKPGTTFAYSTAATCVCAAAVERVTGKKLVDFLDEKLFGKLGINKPRWSETKDCQTLGGVGLYLSSNDLTKFGFMLKNKGVYNGERIISEEYLNNATSSHSVDINNGSIDWISGYGYQFWLNSRGGFRGDGAFGQLCLVFPDEDLVITMLGEVGNMPKEVEVIYNFIDNLYGDDCDETEAANILATRYMTEKHQGFNGEAEFELGENACGISKIRLFGEKLLHLELTTDYGKKELVCGNGEYILNRLMLKNLSPTIPMLDPDINNIIRVSVFASYELDENGGVLITLRHKDTCHVQRWLINPDEKKFDISLHVGDLIQKQFHQ